MHNNFKIIWSIFFYKAISTKNEYMPLKFNAMHNKQINEHKAEKFISIGRIATGSAESILTSSPLGSCIAVIAYDVNTKIGGMAHVMLPGQSPNSDDNRYAEDAINNLIDNLQKLGVLEKNIEICLVGGANVLRKENDNIADQLIDSVYEILKKKKLKVKAASVGGYERRNAKLNLNTGIVYFSIGDSVEKQLYKFTAEDIQEHER